MNLKQPAALWIHLKQLERRGSAEASFLTIKRRKMVVWTTPIWLLRNNAPYTESLPLILRLRNEAVKGGAFLLVRFISSVFSWSLMRMIRMDRSNCSCTVELIEMD